MCVRGEKCVKKSVEWSERWQEVMMMCDAEEGQGFTSRQARKDRQL